MLLQRIALGQYSIPSDVRLSRACLDLLARIFVVHPKRRITLEQIQQHPWFVQNLPPEMQVRHGLHCHCFCRKHQTRWNVSCTALHTVAAAA